MLQLLGKHREDQTPTHPVLQHPNQCWVKPFRTKPTRVLMPLLCHRSSCFGLKDDCWSTDAWDCAQTWETRILLLLPEKEQGRGTKSNSVRSLSRSKAKSQQGRALKCQHSSCPALGAPCQTIPEDCLCWCGLRVAAVCVEQAPSSCVPRAFPQVRSAERILHYLELLGKVPWELQAKKNTCSCTAKPAHRDSSKASSFLPLAKASLGPLPKCELGNSWSFTSAKHFW